MATASPPARRTDSGRSPDRPARAPPADRRADRSALPRHRRRRQRRLRTNRTLAISAAPANARADAPTTGPPSFERTALHPSGAAVVEHDPVPVAVLVDDFDACRAPAPRCAADARRPAGIPPRFGAVTRSASRICTARLRLHRRRRQPAPLCHCHHRHQRHGRRHQSACSSIAEPSIPPANRARWTSRRRCRRGVRRCGGAAAAAPIPRAAARTDLGHCEQRLPLGVQSPLHDRQQLDAAIAVAQVRLDGRALGAGDGVAQVGDQQLVAGGSIPTQSSPAESIPSRAAPAGRARSERRCCLTVVLKSAAIALYGAVIWRRLARPMSFVPLPLPPFELAAQLSGFGAQAIGRPYRELGVDAPQAGARRAAPRPARCRDSPRRLSSFASRFAHQGAQLFDAAHDLGKRRAPRRLRQGAHLLRRQIPVLDVQQLQHQRARRVEPSWKARRSQA